MIVPTHIQEVPLSQVDLDNPLVPVPAVPAPVLLMEALREVGMLCLPWLRLQEDGRLQVVTGLKRLRGAAQLGWKTVTARTLPPETPDSQCLLIHLYDNAGVRGFNPAEQALLASRLLAFWDRRTVAKKFLPYLGQAPAVGLLERLLSLAGLEEPFQELAARGRLALTAAAFLAQWTPEDRTAALPFLERFHWSQSKQEELLEGIDLLARREGVGPREIFSQSELQQGLEESAGLPSERAEALRRRLQGRLSPRFSAAREAFQVALGGLGLNQHPRLRLKPPPAFEGPDFYLEIKFRDAPELQELLDELARKVKRAEFSEMTNL
jgi:ParB-like chromosome segregation protein Spo0J